MKFVATKAHAQPSRRGGICWKVSLNNQSYGKSYTWVDNTLPHYKKWKPVLDELEQGNTVELNGCTFTTINNKKVVDGNSPITVTHINPSTDDIFALEHALLAMEEAKFEKELEKVDPTLLKKYVDQSIKEQIPDDVWREKLKDTLLEAA